MAKSDPRELLPGRLSEALPAAEAQPVEELLLELSDVAIQIRGEPGVPKPLPRCAISQRGRSRGG